MLSGLSFDSYLAGWENFGKAWSVWKDPNESYGERWIAGTYMGTWGGAHAAGAVGLAGLACVASGGVCITAVEGALGIGASVRADGDPTNEYQALLQMAKELYPKLAEKADQMHHIFPKYLGGNPKGPMVALNPAYHQLITNEFRALWAYGQSAPAIQQAQQILEQVYGKFPLP